MWHGECDRMNVHGMGMGRDEIGWWWSATGCDALPPLPRLHVVVMCCVCLCVGIMIGRSVSCGHVLLALSSIVGSIARVSYVMLLHRTYQQQYNTR